MIVDVVSPLLTDTQDASDLRALALDELATDGEAALLAARLTRVNGSADEGSDPVRVAAFNSYI